MKKHKFLRSTLCLLLTLLCNVAWAEKIQPSTTLPDKGKPEHVYTMKNGNNKYANGETAPTDSEAEYGQFAFYAVNDVDGGYYIYSHTAKKWLTYDKADSYNNGANFVKMSDTKGDDDYFNVNNYTGDFYQIAPYNTTGVAGKYLNWFGGAIAGNKLGLWQDNATADAGSRWSFTEKIVVVRTYTIDILGGANGQTIKIGDETYKDGDTYTIEGSVSKGDITVVAPAGQFATVAIDDVNETITVFFANAVSQPATVAYEIPVLYPAQQTAVGEAKATKDGDAYTLSNKVLAASFVKMGGALYFAGSEAMDLVAGTEPFTVAFGNGDNVPASAMTLESVAFEELTGKADAVGGAEHYDGHALVANYKYTYKESTIAIVWRAVLRDGSHYLRTEMELKGEDDVDMFNIIPMIYNVDTKAAGSTPEVIGNTRGAVLMSDKIFAGLETPTAYNTVGDATGEEDNWNLTTTIDPVTVESTAWVQMTEAEANQAKRVEEATGATYPNLYAFKKESVELVAGQKVEVTLTYKQGSNKLYIGGIDLLASNGDIAAMDYHVGYTGSSHDKNTYTFIAPNTGTYAIRAIVHNAQEAINAKSELTAKIYTPKEGVVINTDIVGIQGRWSRNTTLAAGETWKVASVVGLIAQDGTQANADIHSTQKRRSFLAYSERERAVPWRAMSMYLAWYELQINRNNAAPGREHIDNTEESEVLDVMDHWKSDFYSRYGIAPEIFIVDDGWDKYGEWTFHPGFPDELRNMSAAAKEMGSSIGAWLGPVGGYGQSGNYRRDYWSDKGGMQLSNPRYYKAFKDAAYNLVKNQGDNYVFFKFDGISAQFSATGPDAGDTGNENAEGIIRLEQYVREELREDIFFNTSVGTWASPFWYQITDATWRQENDHDRTGNNSINRENWITYRDRLVYQNYVQNSPICPINTLMTHGFILTKFGPPAGDSREYIPVRNELRAAFLCGSGMVELYNDYDLMNSINGGALWADLAECIAWQKRNADVLPDAHWVGGNPWTGSKAEVYGWAAWNGTKSSLALRNGANEAQEFKFTLRQALNIPANVNGSIILRSAFGVQDALEGLSEGTAIDIDTELTVKLPGSSVYGFEGIDASAATTKVKSITLTAENNATEIPVNKTLVVKAVVNTDATFPALVWSSSNTEVATVVGGLVQPKKAGTVTITATAKDGSGMTASVTIKVTPKVWGPGELVTDLDELSNDKVYTIRSARAFLLYSENEDVKNGLCTSTGKKVGSVTFDNTYTNPNQQFRIEKIGTKYYLYSVGAQKYVGADGNYEAAPNTELKITKVDGDYPWLLVLGGKGLNSQVGGQKDNGIVINGWTTADAGNCYQIAEAVAKAEVYSITVLGAEGAKVTFEGKEYQNGSTFESNKTLQKSDFSPDEVDGKFAVVNIEGFNIYVSYFADDTKFYTMQNGKGGYVSLSEGYHDNGNLKLTNSTKIKDRMGLWAFVAQDGGGYKIYNYSTGLSKVLGMTGSEAAARASMVAEGTDGYTTVFDGNVKFDGTDGRIKLKGSDNNYWNNRDGYLALWNSSAATGDDSGSKFFMVETNIADLPAEPIQPELKEELSASKIQGVSTYSPKNPNTLWYTTSAEATGVSYPWMEYALPLGNGELGCMVFGGVLKEEVQFNEKTLWSGPANVVGAGGGHRTFMNFGSVFVKNLDETLNQGVTDYVRYLDIEEGIAGVSFKNANGTKQTRKYFSSAPDQVIAAQYKSEGDDKMSLLFKLEAEADIEADFVKYENGMASFTGKMEAVSYAARLHVKADEDAVITTTSEGIKVENATEVTFYLKGGTNFDGNVKNTTSYFTTEDAAAVNDRVKNDMETAAAKGFAAIETAHVDNFTAITKRMTLNLGLTTPTVDTKTLIDNYYPNNGDANSTQNDHLFLEQLYFHFGRYLAISSNRKDIAAPNNLQGIWNDRGTDSPWNSDIHTNINVQMNYWPTEITNLSDLHKPFVNFIIRGAQTEGWKNVAKQYNNNDEKGWAILTETSLYGSMSTWGAQYLVANVWYTSHLWTHFRYTQDKEFLKEAFPVMWSAAEFWFHRLIEDRGFDNTQDEQESVRNYHTPYSYEPDGTFVAPNEFSAEQHDNESEDGTAHAQQMIYYLFTNIKEAIDILGGKEAVNLTSEDIAKLDLYLEKTDKGLHTEKYTGAWGETYNGVNKDELLLREWKYTPFDISNDKGHRHMSHLMALFPMDQITPESEYFIPAVNSMKLRGDAATGWSMGWKVNLWARAQDGDHAHIIIKNALKHSTSYGTAASAGGIYYNLFDSHAPFQIDGNFGVCSGMAEMLMQSAHGYINILPALPAVWEKIGAVTGMKAMGNFTVDFNWQNGKAQQVTIVSNAGAELKVRCNRGAMNIANAMITVDGAEVEVVVDENGIATIPCAKGDEVVIDFTQERSPAAPAEFKQYWTANPIAPWSATALEAGKYPEAVAVNGFAVHKAETAVVAPVAGDVTATFVYSGGSHKLNILGVDLVKADGTVVASDYHHGTTGGSHSKNTYTLTGVTAGEYTLRYFVGQGNGDALSQTNGAITVVGLSLPGATPSNLPKAGKYYRIGYDFGGNVGVLYMQSTASGVSGKANALLMTDEKGEGSIFLVEEVSGNLRLKSISTGKYLKEDNSNRGLATEGANVTFTEGADGKIKIQVTSYLHPNVSGTTYFVDRCGNDGCAQHNLIVEEVKVRSLTVEGPAYAGATATWNGATKALPATWTVFGGTAVTESTLTVEAGVNYTLTGLYEKGIKVSTPVEIATLTSNRTFTAEFAPAFFSTEDNLVPVRIRSARNNAYTIRLNASDSYTGKAVNSGVTVYGENEIWYLVGTPESFKIYNRVAGMNLHVVLAGTSQESAASMNITTDNSDFCLVAKDNGYAICPKSNTDQSFNMFGGAGADIKLYGSGDGGSIWLIEKMDASKSLTFSVNIKGEPWEGNRGAGAITITVDGIAGKANIESFVGEQKCYLPLNGTFTIASDTYRGYTFNGFNVNGSTIETLVDQTLSEDLNVVASYTANEEKVLYYTPSPTGNPYRIPAIATAPNGHIFAIADHRPCGNDIGYGEVDIKCRISTDNGATWSDEFFIADGQGGDSNNMTTGYGDAAVVADRESNKLLVMMVAGRTVCHNGEWTPSKIGNADADAVNRVARIYLTYNETTGEWEKSEIVEMTDHIYSLFLDGETPTVTSMFIGSGKICQSRVVKTGDYYRLYCSMWTRNGGNRVIYSDDFGGSWNVLGTIKDRPASGGDEPKVEELRDGTVVLSSRVGGGRIFNLFTFADNTYTTGSWGTAVRSNEITNGLSFGGNSTNGEIYKVKAIHKESGRICDLMLQSIPTGGGRSDVAIYYKELDAAKYTTTTIAQNWTKGKHVSYKGSAYSTMISQADGRIAFLFEEEPGGYCIVYIPYTIEDVTGGAYSLYQVNSTIGQYEIGTFYASEAVVIPEGVKAYVATEQPTMENGTGVITMSELEGIIPAHTGAVLRGAAAEYKFIPSISYGTAVKDNMLVGYEADNNKAESKKAVTVAADYTTYVLTVKDEKAGFYRKEKGATFNVANNKAYLDLTTAAQGAQSISIRFEDGTTSIDNEQLTIDNESTAIYDLMGRRVINPTKGVYIVNGKKVIIR